MSVRRSGPARAAVIAAGLSVAGAGAFGWGFAAQKYHVFPFHWLRAAALRAGALRSPMGIALTAPSTDQLALLRSLPYSGSTAARAGTGGVIRRTPDRVSPGLTLVSTHHAGRSTPALLDPAGRVVWSWRLPPGEPAWAVRLLADGSVIAVESYRALMRVEAGGELRWRVDGEFHHAAEIHGDRIVTLRQRTRRIPPVHATAGVLDDEVVAFDLEGRELESFSLLDAILASPFHFFVPALSDAEILAQSAGRAAADTRLDVLHSNHVERLDAAASAAFGPGGGDSWLVSLRNLHVVALIGAERHDVRWIWGPGRLVLQHVPTLTAAGHLLLFNNGTSRSEVIEIDPGSHRVVWRNSADDLHTRGGGSGPRLANGNTLITDSDSGRVLEVTPAGDCVWEWLNPEVEGGVRAGVYRAIRYAPAAPELAFLGRAG